MWEYNNIYNSNENTDELCHYGIPGMRWGRRKAARYEAKAARATKRGNTDAANRYTNMAKSASELGKAGQRLKETKKTRIRGLTISGKNVQAITEKNQKLKSQSLDVLDAKAKYNAAKAKDKYGAKKAEQKTYMKEFLKVGAPGSASDRANNRRGTDVYDRVVSKKGRQYANEVVSKARNSTIKAVAASAAVAIGATVAKRYWESLH